MRVLLDESLPKALISVFRRHGFTVFDIRALRLHSVSDDAVYRVAQARRAVIVTADLDFANALRFPPRRHHGILILRFPSTLTVPSMCAEVHQLLQRFPPRNSSEGLSLSLNQRTYAGTSGEKSQRFV